MQDIKMLQHIHKSSELGKVATEAALRDTNDPKMRQILRSQLHRYREIYSTSTNQLLARGIPPQSANPIARLNLSFSPSLRAEANPAIAKKMIRSNKAEYTKSAQQLRNYTGSDLTVRNLANELLHTEEKSIEQMKPFL